MSADRGLAAQVGADIVGISESRCKTLALVNKITPPQAPVLIAGHSVVGKEVVAQALHRLSRRAGHGLTRPRTWR